jgi:hypothetical protein
MNKSHPGFLSIQVVYYSSRYSRTLSLILLIDPVLVGAGGYVLDPGLIIKVPLDCFADAGLEGLSGFPAEFAVDLGRVDGVAAVVTGTIGDIGDLLFVALSIRARGKLVKDGTEGMDDVEVRLLVPPANVVGLPHPACLEDTANGGGVVLHIEPVAHLLAVAVDGERLAGEGIVDHQWDKLLREVVGAVVVGAVRRENREAVGVVVGTNEVIGGRLAGRVGAVRLVLLGLSEGWICRRQRSIDLVSGDMEEAEGFLGRIIESIPVGTGGLKESEGADDVCLDELGRPMNGAIDMGLGGKVDDGPRLMLCKELRNEFGIANIATDEGMAGIPLQGGEVLEVARISELVEINDGVVLKSDPVEDEVGTDEAGAAGNEDGGVHRSWELEEWRWGAEVLAGKIQEINGFQTR